MNIVNWKQNVDFVTNAQAKLESVNGTNWKSFLGALGKVEGNDQYNNLNGVIGVRSSI